MKRQSLATVVGVTSLLIVAIPFVQKPPLIANAAEVPTVAFLSTSRIKEINTTLSILLQEHGVLLSETSFGLIDATPNVSAAENALRENNQKIGTEVESFFGKEKRDTFMKNWNKHTNLFLQYARASSINDTTKKKEISSELDIVTKNIAQIFPQGSGIRSQVQSDLKNHTSYEKAIIDAHTAKKYALQYSLLNGMLEESRKMIDTLFTNLTS